MGGQGKNELFYHKAELGEILRERFGKVVGKRDTRSENEAGDPGVFAVSSRI